MNKWRVYEWRLSPNPTDSDWLVEELDANGNLVDVVVNCGSGEPAEALARRIVRLPKLEAIIASDDCKAASLFQAEPHTEHATDKWQILTLRILEMLDRADVADGLEAEVEQLQAIIADLLKACKLTTDLCEAAGGITCWTPDALRVLGQTYAAIARAAIAKAETAKEVGS